MDCDNFAAVDPTYLFDLPEFTETGIHRYKFKNTSSFQTCFVLSIIKLLVYLLIYT
jgi:hypothetical protein